jgi:hypothetical protein
MVDAVATIEVDVIIILCILKLLSGYGRLGFAIALDKLNIII